MNQIKNKQNFQKDFMYIVRVVSNFESEDLFYIVSANDPEEAHQNVTLDLEQNKTIKISDYWDCESASLHTLVSILP